MPLIVDCYNVLHCTHVLPERHALVGAVGLCELIARSQWGEGGAMVVCDGTPNPTDPDPPPEVELIYAGPGRDADSLIERLIEESTAPRRLVVVSDDHRIQKAARKRRAKALASTDFLLALIRRPAGPGRDTDNKPRAVGDVEAWMKEFGYKVEPEDRKPRPGKPSHPPRPDESETDRWLRRFGFDPEDT